MESHKGSLILLRHGASVWNEKNLFTGWVDIPLSNIGVQESLKAGQQIANLSIDIIFTSSLIRAQMTAMLAMMNHSSKKVPCILHSKESSFKEMSNIYSEKISQETIPMITAWELNERMYGQLQGKNKDEMCQEFGTEQVKLWRRGFDNIPPGGESLKMTSERTLPYFQKEILTQLDKGKHVLIVAHGNSLRSITMALENLSSKEVIELEFSTGVPCVYEWVEKKWRRRAL